MEFRELTVLAAGSETSCGVLATVLGQLGVAAVLRAHDLDQAVETARTGRPGLVLCDWSAPGLSGLELLGKVRALPGMGRVPVVVVFAERNAQDVIRAVRAGASGYLRKPFGAAELRLKVRQALGLE